MFNSISTKAVLAGVALSFGATTAFAASLPLSYSTTASGTTGSGVHTSATSADSYGFNNSHGNLTNAVFANFEFYDDYIFEISGSTVNSVSTTIQLGNEFGLANMEARIYNWSSNQAVPVLGQPAGTVFTSSSATLGNVTILTIDNVTLSAGSYVLELRGGVSGTLGGSYAGVLNVAPQVPVPAALWLMGSALVGLGTIGRKRAH